MKRIGPDPTLVKQVSEVLAQNKRILDMNAQIIRAIMLPPYVISGKNKIDIHAMRPGEIVRE
jgi:L-asparaginase II